MLDLARSFDTFNLSAGKNVRSLLKLKLCVLENIESLD